MASYFDINAYFENEPIVNGSKPFMGTLALWFTFFARDIDTRSLCITQYSCCNAHKFIVLNAHALKMRLIAKIGLAFRMFVYINSTYFENVYLSRQAIDVIDARAYMCGMCGKR